MNKPKIRFKGFNDDWEQRKLFDIANKVTEKNKNNEFSEPFTNSAEQGIVSQREYFDREIVNNENLDGYYIVRNNDFIYNPRISVTAPVGPINRNRLGRNGVMSPLYTIFRTHNIDNLFLEFYFKTTSWHRYMKLNGDSGARFDRFTISSVQFMKMPIPYPMLAEQKKIGEYLDNLDHLITLHQWKCRFLVENEVNDREQRKLEELYNITTGRLDANAMVLDGQYDFYTSGIDVFKIDKAAFEGPAITIAGNGASVGYMHLADGKFNAYQRTYVLTDFSADRQFLNVAIGNMLPDKIQEEVRGSGIPYIVLNMLTDLVIPFPSQKEQATIGAYFEGLDHLITLHQWKCLIYVKIEIYDKNHRKLIKIVIIFEFILVFIFAFMLIHIRMLYFSIRYILLRFTGVINVIMVVKIIVLIVIIGDDVYGRIRIDN